MRRFVALLALLLAAPGSASARTTIVLVPGSGYRGADAYDGSRMANGEAKWRSWGFRTRVAPYGPGKVGREDVAAAARAAVRRGGRVCLYGESSGGTWALDAAANVPGVDCVMTGAAPTDEDTWRDVGPDIPAYTFAYDIWPAYFGTGTEDDEFEPFDVWKNTSPNVPAFVVVANNDPTVPVSQGRVMATLPGVTMRVLVAGKWPFVHSEVSHRQLERVRAQMRRFARHA